MDRGSPRLHEGPSRCVLFIILRPSKCPQLTANFVVFMTRLVIFSSSRYRDIKLKNALNSCRCQGAIKIKNSTEFEIITISRTCQLSGHKETHAIASCCHDAGAPILNIILYYPISKDQSGHTLQPILQTKTEYRTRDPLTVTCLIPSSWQW